MLLDLIARVERIEKVLDEMALGLVKFSEELLAAGESFQKAMISDFAAVHARLTALESPRKGPGCPVGASEGSGEG